MSGLDSDPIVVDDSDGSTILAQVVACVLFYWLILLQKLLVNWFIAHLPIGVKMAAAAALKPAGKF